MLSEQEIGDIRGFEDKRLSRDDLKNRYGQKIPGFFLEWKSVEISKNPEIEKNFISGIKFERCVTSEFFSLVWDGNLSEILIRERLGIEALLKLICEKTAFLFGFEHQKSLFEENTSESREANQYWNILNDQYRTLVDQKVKTALRVWGLPSLQSDDKLVDGVLLSMAGLYKQLLSEEKVVGLSIREQKLVVKKQLLDNYVKRQIDFLRYRQQDPAMSSAVGKEVVSGTDRVVGKRIKMNKAESAFWAQHKSELVSEVYVRLSKKVNGEQFLLYSDLSTLIGGIARTTAMEIVRKEYSHGSRSVEFTDPGEEDDYDETGSARALKIDAGIDEARDELDLGWGSFYQLYLDAVPNVPPEQLELFVLKHKEGVSTDDLIRITGSKDANVLGSRLNRAKNALWREICKAALKRNTYLKRCNEQ